MIEIVPIAENRYAPDAARSINLYNLDAGKELTLGQLMALVCLKAGALAEARSIAKLNQMNQGTVYLDEGSSFLEQLATNTVTDWAAMKIAMVEDLGVDITQLPDNVDSFDKRLQAIKALKTQLESLTRQSQEDMIAVQSLVSSRNTSFSTATNLIAGMGQTKNNTAQNF